MIHDTWLTPDQARARFGELTFGPTRTHYHFSADGGEWRPEFGQSPAGLVLRGYRLHPDLRPPVTRTPYRPKA